jgi:type II secretion system protein H
MVVLVILGVMSSFIALSLTPDSRRETETEAARLRVLLETALQEAQLTGRPLAWLPQTAGYRFLQGDMERRWQAVTNDEQFRPRQLAEGMRIAGISVDGQALAPDAMLVLPSNGAPAFRIDLDSPQGRYVLQGRPNGRVDLVPPRKP